jgi:cephalosporin hydroxylase
MTRGRPIQWVLVLGMASAFGCSSCDRAYQRGYRDGRAEGLASEEEVINRFHRIFYDKKDQTWLANRWLGVQTSQNPNDVWITQEILFEQKPDFMVEAGTKHAGSALIWAMVLKEVNPQARVITIDIEDKIGKARDISLFRERVDFLLGSSTDPKVVDEVKRRVAGKKVVVLLDSDHSRKHVLAEMRAYAPIVSRGSYMIVQDGILSGHPVKDQMGGGPGKRSTTSGREQDFQIDRWREGQCLQYCPRGYLRRIR